MNSTVVILNPAAHSDRASALVDEITAIARGATVRLTSAVGDARAIASEAVENGVRTVVAAGGDGTVHEVVNGIANSEAILGVLPVGTMNVFATELGIPSGDLDRAWNIVSDGHVRAVDLPTANDEPFVQLAGVGLDAEVVRRTRVDSKRALGPISYLLTLAQVASRQPPTIRIEPFDGPPRDGSFVLIGNGRLYGGPFVLFKDAAPDDGLLDVLVFQNQSHWDLIRYFQAIAFGNHADLPDVEYFQSSGLRLMSREYVPVELDGEHFGALPCEFRLSRARLRVLTPRPAAGG